MTSESAGGAFIQAGMFFQQNMELRKYVLGYLKKIRVASMARVIEITVLGNAINANKLGVFKQC